MQKVPNNKESNSTKTGTGNATDLRGRCSAFARKNGFDADAVYEAQPEGAKREDGENKAAQKKQEAKDAKAKTK